MAIRLMKKQTGERDDQGQWQTIYCSLMLLLVVLFLMLTAFSSIDQERMTRLNIAEKATPGAAQEATETGRAMQSLQQKTDVFGAEVTIRRTPDGFKAVIPTPALFASGEADLNERILPMLEGIAAVARENRLSIQIEGHTDNIPIETPKFPSNWELSATRAVNILRYLQTAGRVPSDKLVAVGFAEFRPLADNGTPEGRQRNRRIEILFRRTL